MGSYGEHSVRLKNSAPSFPLPAKASGQGRFGRIIRHVLERDQRICQMCGADETCVCPYDRNRVSLFVRLIKPMARGGAVEPSNMRAICSTCADGIKSERNHATHRQNAAPIKPDRLQLLAQIRRATLTDQKEVLDWLLQKFKLKSHPVE